MNRRKFLKSSLALCACTTLAESLLFNGKVLATNPQRSKGSSLLASKALDGFKKRRDFLLENTAGRVLTSEMLLDSSKDWYGNRAIANLVLHRYASEANKHLQYTGRWFEHSHPGGRSLDGEPDFTAIKLCRASYLFRNSSEIEKETQECIQKFFLNQDFRSQYGSENHGLMFRVSRHLMGQLFPEKVFNAYGKKGKALTVEDAEWIKDFIRYRAKRGWGEFDSSAYIAEEWGILLTLYDYTEDAELKHLAEMMLNLILADLSVDSLNGMVCGAQGRIYMPQALDHANESTFPLQYLYFGMIPTDLVVNKEVGIDALVSGFRPNKIVLELALDRPMAYENLERKHLHNTADIKPEHPLEGSIRKYTYCTPQYIMGCVQLQDPYPEGSSKWYAFHEQHDWDLSFASSTRARIFTHHPGKEGNEHNYWTGDLKCGCGHFFQHKTALICLYDIPENEPYQFIHAHLPKKEFEEVFEVNNILFVRTGDTFAALKLLGGYTWTTQGEWAYKELISQGGKNAVVCEVGRKADYGSFKNFSDTISANTITFDPVQMKLSYNSKNAGKLTMDTNGLRLFNDQPMPLDYPTYGSPFMKSEWDSGLITIYKNGGKMVLDFRA